MIKCEMILMFNDKIFSPAQIRLLDRQIQFLNIVQWLKILVKCS